MSSDGELENAKVYFTTTQGFARLLKAMAQKYQSLGRWGGSVTLTSLQDEEREALAVFFRTDFSRQKSVTISLERFAKALEWTKFSGVSPVRLLEELQGESLLSNAQRLAQKEQAKAEFFQELAAQYSQPYCQCWLGAIMAKKPAVRSVHTAYDLRPELLRTQMDYVLKALADINRHPQNKIERLPVFARRITQDPHRFDPNSDTGRLLLQAFRVIDSERPQLDQMTRTLTGSEELTELYYSFGLLRDDLWNFVTCTGITATAVDDQDKLLGYLTEAYRQNVTLNLPLREVVRIGSVYSGLPSKEDGHPKDDIKDNINVINNMGDISYISDINYINDTAERTVKEVKRVFVVENSGVFSALLDHYRDYCEAKGFEEQPNPPLLCTHGQFKLASLLLLDKLAAGGTLIYYSGDFDPEGLLMAEQLLQRHPNQVKPWHFTLADYRLALSKQVLNPQRLKKLDRVVSSELAPLKEEILRRALAGYQEGILAELWRDVRELEPSYF